MASSSILYPSSSRSQPLISQLAWMAKMRDSWHWALVRDGGDGDVVPWTCWRERRERYGREKCEGLRDGGWRERARLSFQGLGFRGQLPERRESEGKGVLIGGNVRRTRLGRFRFYFPFFFIIKLKGNGPRELSRVYLAQFFISWHFRHLFLAFYTFIQNLQNKIK